MNMDVRKLHSVHTVIKKIIIIIIIIILPDAKTVYCSIRFPNEFDAVQIRVPVSVTFILITNFSVTADN